MFNLASKFFGAKKKKHSRRYPVTLKTVPDSKMTKFTVTRFQTITSQKPYPLFFWGGGGGGLYKGVPSGLSSAYLSVKRCFLLFCLKSLEFEGEKRVSVDV